MFNSRGKIPFVVVLSAYLLSDVLKLRKPEESLVVLLPTRRQPARVVRVRLRVQEHFNVLDFEA